MLTHFSLFTGIGGIDLAAEWAGFETVGQCEWADYPTKVLEKHWPDVPRWRNIRSVTKESFAERTNRRTVDLISGGFPCQPFSVAGKQKGKDDDRYLWPEMLRVVSELRPNWVLGENVAGIVNMALDTVLSDLEALGYEVQAYIIPACGVDAPHRRNRVFIVANAIGRGCGEIVQRGRMEGIRGARPYNTMQITESGTGVLGDAERCGCDWDNRRRAGAQLTNGCKDVANAQSERRREARTHCERSAKWASVGGVMAYTDNPGMERCEIAGSIEGLWTKRNKYAGRCGEGDGAWAAEPNVGRVANGIPSRVDRLKCLGNAVVPQQVYPILQAIADIEANR